MNLEVTRLTSNANSTIGVMHIDDRWVAFTCEDAHHDQKIMGKTRIPAGTYDLALKPVGSSKFDGEYSQFKLQGGYHGMIELQNVPNYEGVLIHIGNSAKDTEGCILVGLGANAQPDSAGSFTIQASAVAFYAVYPQIAQALLSGEGASITVVDAD